MATRLEIDRLISITKNNQLTWVVTGVPVVACFPTNGATGSMESLGSTSDRNNCHDSLLLWIARDRRACELLVTLTIRIKASNNRKPNHRLLYLVVPAEGLVLRSSVVKYESLARLPCELFDVPNDVDSGKHDMLHMSFDLGPQTSFVIMQAYPSPPKLALQPETLLRKLRSLSKSSCFDLYAIHDDTRQRAIENVSAAQLNADTTTPKIVLRGLFPGGRAGCIDDWENQGLCKEFTPCGTVSKSLDQAPDHAVQESCLSLPPPYAPKDLSRGACITMSLGSPDLPYLPSTTALDAPADISWLPSTAVTMEPAHHHASTSVPEIGRVFSSVSPPSPSRRDPTPSSGYTATFLSNTVRGPHGQIVQVVASPLNSNDSSSIVTRTPSYTADSLPVSTRKRPSSTPLDPNRCSAKRIANQLLATNEASSLSPSHLSTVHSSAVSYSPTIEGISLCCSGQAEDGHGHLHGSVVRGIAYMSKWLKKAWKICPSAHYSFIAELLKLGVATASGNSDEIATCSVECTLALLRYDLKERLARDSGHNPVVGRDFQVDTSTLASWLYALQPGADIDFYSHLLQLTFLEDQLSQSSSDEALKSDHLRATYLRRKAELVSQACTRVAKGVLRQGETAVVARMRREKDRLAAIPQKKK